MMIDKVTLFHFSPNGLTRKTALNVIKGLGSVHVDEVDLSDFKTRWTKTKVSANSLAVFAFPVYSGRLPQIAKEVFNHFSSEGALAVALVVYGNRDFEDALLELKNNLIHCGFVPMAAAAFIAEHAMNPLLGSHRPDSTDLEIQVTFGKQIKEKIDGIVNPSEVSIEVSGHYPYRELSDLPIAPTLIGTCDHCMQCAENCPVCAIDPVDPARTDAFRCILCLRCVSICPNKARAVTNEKYTLSIEKLALMYRTRKEPSLFI